MTVGGTSLCRERGDEWRVSETDNVTMTSQRGARSDENTCFTTSAASSHPHTHCQGLAVHQSCTCNSLIPNNAITLILIISMQQKIPHCSLPFIAVVSDSLIQPALIHLMCPAPFGMLH